MLGAHQTTVKEMEDNRQRLGIFRITLFGRTMAGKPTPMELLTEGNGDMTSWVDSGRGWDRTLWGKAAVESAMDGWSADWENPSELVDGILACGVHTAGFPLLSVRQFGLPAPQFSPGAGDGHALAVAHTAETSFELGEGVRQRKRAGLTVEPEPLAHISPLGWAHVLLTGEYRWPKRQ